MKHLINTQIPFSKSQMMRIYYASKGIPDPRGELYDLENNPSENTNLIHTDIEIQDLLWNKFLDIQSKKNNSEEI